MTATSYHGKEREANGVLRSRERLFSNHEIVTLAVYLLGGKSSYVDTEDIAVRANELAPGRFTWRKYPDQINLEVVRVYLSDAKKVDKGAYLLGSGTEGWLLTEKGLKFAQRRLQDLRGVDVSRKPTTARERKIIRAERARMLASEAFAKYKLTGLDSVTHQEAESFFRIDAYLTTEQRKRKVARAVNLYSNDSILGTAVRELAERVKGS
jgi:hypothetical protein